MSSETIRTRVLAKARAREELLSSEPEFTADLVKEAPAGEASELLKVAAPALRHLEAAPPAPPRTAPRVRLGSRAIPPLPPHLVGLRAVMRTYKARIVEAVPTPAPEPEPEPEEPLSFVSYFAGYVVHSSVTCAFAPDEFCVDDGDALLWEEVLA